MASNRRGGKTVNFGRYKNYASGGKRSLQRSINYARHRPDDQHPDRADRTVFDRSSEGLSNTDVLDRFDQFAGQTSESRTTYTQSIVINPGEGRTDADLQEYTRRVMAEFEEQRAERNARVDWVAVVHRDQSEHDHIHVYIVTDKTVSKPEITHMQTHEGSGRAWDEVTREAEQRRELSATREIPVRGGRELEEDIREKPGSSARDYYEEQQRER